LLSIPDTAALITVTNIIKDLINMKSC